jgi:hypothetical protein
VKALAFLENDLTETGFIRASALLNVAFTTLDSRKLSQSQFRCQSSTVPSTFYQVEKSRKKRKNGAERFD